MDVVVSGSTGLIGRALVAALRADGHRVLPLVRPGGSTAGEHVAWDPEAGTIEAAGLEGADAVVHLAGAGIGDHRWSEAYKRTIMESRTKGTSLLATTLAGLQRPPGVLVSGSAVGIYGDRGDEPLTEASTLGTGFLAEVCKAWEAAAEPAAQAGTRVVTIRTGIVLSTEGGSLPKLLPLFRFGLGGRFGSGRQWMSWITLDDHVAAVRHLLGAADVHGPVNLTAPEPATNAELTAVLGHVLHRPALLPIPRFGPALVKGGELADALLYTGQRVLPAALEASGFAFGSRELDGALHDVLGHQHAH